MLSGKLNSAAIHADAAGVGHKNTRSSCRKSRPEHTRLRQGAAEGLPDTTPERLNREKMVEGRANIQKFWQGAMTAGLKISTLETVDVETQGNTAVEIGRYTSTVPGAGGTTTTDKGKYVVVWKRERGSWKLAVDIFNTSMPPATATP